MLLLSHLRLLLLLRRLLLGLSHLRRLASGSEQRLKHLRGNDSTLAQLSVRHELVLHLHEHVRCVW